MEATSADISLQAGHFIDRGGKGSFFVSQGAIKMPTGRHLLKAWAFNRGFEYKKDVAIRATGMWVLNTAASGAGAITAASGAGSAAMRTLEEIQTQVGYQFQTL